MRLEAKFLVIFLLLFTFNKVSLGQELLFDTSIGPGVKNAAVFYNTSLATQLHIFNGKEYKEYIKPFTLGQPYFLTPGWSIGRINYDGNVYDSVPLIYNVVTDEVIISYYKDLVKIQLLKEKLNGFSFSGHTFLKINPDTLVNPNLKAGFYDVLDTGRVTLLARRTKNIQTYTNQTVELKVYAKDYYYLKRNNEYSDVRNRKEFLKQLGDRKKEIQEFIKQNRIRLKKDGENAMIRIVKRYNELDR